MSDQKLSALHTQPVSFRSVPNEAISLVSLNAALEQGLHQFGREIHAGSIVARSEHLPLVKGDVHQLNRLMENLLALVLRKGEIKPPQYLHVDCTEEKSEVLDLTLEEGFRYYHIEFKTNRKTDISSNGNNNIVLEECNEILKTCRGTLQLFCVEGEGCLFSILLQGKMS